MRYKTIKGLCKYVAQCNQQNKVKELYDRQIWRVADFSEQDNKEIDITANLLQATINDHKSIIKTYRDFQQFLGQLQDIAQYYFFGTLVQDEIIATSGMKLNWKE